MSFNVMSSKKAIILILVLVLISPLFGVTLSDIVGYHEPLDIAAEELGLEDISEAINWTPFFDYTVPCLPDEVGYIIAGLMGIGIILAIGYAILKISGEKR